METGHFPEFFLKKTGPSLAKEFRMNIPVVSYYYILMLLQSGRMAKTIIGSSITGSTIDSIIGSFIFFNFWDFSYLFISVSLVKIYRNYKVFLPSV